MRPAEVFLNAGEGQTYITFFRCLSILILLFGDFFSMKTISVPF